MKVNLRIQPEHLYRINHNKHKIHRIFRRALTTNKAKSSKERNG